MESDDIILSEGASRTPAQDQPRRGWAIVQRVDDTDPVRANAQALADLEQGATGLSLVFEGAPNAFGYGLPATPEALEIVLRDVVLTRTHLRIDVHPASRAMADWLVSLLGRKRTDPAKLSLSFGIDPAAIFAGTGRLRMSIEALQASMPQSLSHVIALGVPGILLEADGRVFHNAGASAAQEVAIVLATAMSHMRLFEEARQALVYAAPHIGFALSVDDDPETTSAKIAVLRELWDKLQTSRSIAPARATIHAETSFRIMSARADQANLERAASAAANAAAAGVDSLSLLPATIGLGLPGTGARRAALAAHLNVAAQTSSKEPRESDIAGLATAAWSEFRSIEAEGGVLQSLLRGKIQDRVLEARRQRSARLAQPAKGMLNDVAHSGADIIRADKRALPAEGAVFCRRLEWWREEDAALD